MSYTKTNWQNLPNQTTPITAERLNNMENGIANSNGAIGVDEYSSSSTYIIGSYCLYNNKLYICKTAISTPEEWDSTKWDETNVLSSAGGNEIAIGTISDITPKTKLFVEESTQKLKYKDTTTGQFEDISGDEVVIGEITDITEDTKILIDESEGTDAYSEVINSLEGDEIAKAPSVHAVNEALGGFGGSVIPYEITNTPAHSGGTNSYQLIKLNKFVNFDMGALWFQDLAVNTWGSIGTLPNILRPSQTIAGIGIVYSSNGSLIGYGRVEVETSGNIRIRISSTIYSLSAISFCISWFID